jgi:hypothetical protein
VTLHILSAGQEKFPEDGLGAIVVTVPESEDPRILVIAESIFVAFWALQEVVGVHPEEIFYDHGGWYLGKNVNAPFQDALVQIVHDTEERPHDWPYDFASPSAWDGAMALSAFVRDITPKDMRVIAAFLLHPWS